MFYESRECFNAKAKHKLEKEKKNEAPLSFEYEISTWGTEIPCIMQERQRIWYEMSTISFSPEAQECAALICMDAQVHT